jgi:hypothetical protein
VPQYYTANQLYFSDALKLFDCATSSARLCRDPGFVELAWQVTGGTIEFFFLTEREVILK